jgi:hypothetical protein
MGNPEADSVVPAVGLSVTCHGRTVEAQQVTDNPVSQSEEGPKKLQPVASLPETERK